MADVSWTEKELSLFVRSLLIIKDNYNFRGPLRNYLKFVRNVSKAVINHPPIRFENVQLQKIETRPKNKRGLNR